MKLFNFYKNRQQIAQLRSRLLRLAQSWCSNIEQAEDLVQETLTRALKSHSSIEDSRKLDSWVFAIMANCFKDCLRKSRPQHSYEESIDEDALTADEALQQKRTVSQVRNAIAALSENQRVVITMVDLEEFSYADVARILDIPVGTVMSRLNRARNQLKQSVLLQKNSSSVVIRPHLERVK